MAAIKNQNEWKFNLQFIQLKLINFCETINGELDSTIGKILIHVFSRIYISSGEELFFGLKQQKQSDCTPSEF